MPYSHKGGFGAYFLPLHLHVIGKRIIDFLRKHQMSDEVRAPDPPGTQLAKRGVPTMGGIIIICSLVIPVLPFLEAQ